MLINTKSSAVAERPHEALCLSVASFNSTIPQMHSFTISNLCYRFTNAHNETDLLLSVYLSKLAVINKIY